ncbi:MAG: BatD family protein [Thermodesulfobacteriota bacterium]|nr:BatD family protein [Thermodesulfobacteriota bacterium]
MRKIPCITLIFALLIPCLAGAEISVSLKLDRREATLSDVVKMMVKVSGTRDSTLQPLISGLESFNVSQGGTSSRVEIVNGKFSSSIDYTYFIQPQKIGIFTIGPAKISIKGQPFVSNKETLKVIDSSQLTSENRDPIFLSASVSSQRVYVEEQVIYVLKLHRLVKVSDISLSLPEQEHLVFKQLGKPEEYQSTLDGQPYQVLEVQYALIPSKMGDYEIESSKMSMTVFQPRSQTRRGLFDNPFFNDPFFSFSTGKPMTVTSNRVPLKVFKLPEEKRPANFSGLVGNFHLDATLNPQKIKAGESATFTATLKGQGNVNRLPNLKMPELNHIKVYADEPVLEVESHDERLTGTKTMKWALVPEKEGNYLIPPLSVSYFDTKRHEYRMLQTSPISLSVLAGEQETVNTSAPRAEEEKTRESTKQTIKELGRDILPVHTSLKYLTIIPLTQSKGVISWVVILAPILVYTVILGTQKLSKRSEHYQTRLKAKRALKHFNRQCRPKTVNGNDLLKFIRDYFNNRLNYSLGSLTPDEAAKIARSKGVNVTTAEKLQAMLQDIENVIYTGKGSEPIEIKKELAKLIKQIEKEIR